MTFKSLLKILFVSTIQYTIAMMGYAPEHETIVLELTYNYGVTEYTKGNAYAQVCFPLFFIFFFFSFLVIKVSCLVPGCNQHR